MSDAPSRISTVTFVCTGNVIRSPVAAEMLRRYATDAPLVVESRGLVDLGPVPAHADAILAAYALGVDVRDHRARVLERGELADADLVLGFEPRHTSAAVVDGGAQLSRTFTLVEFAELVERSHSAHSGSLADVTAEAAARRTNPLSAPAVPDPVAAGGAEIARTIRVIDGLVARIAPFLKGRLD